MVPYWHLPAFGVIRSGGFDTTARRHDTVAAYPAGSRALTIHSSRSRFAARLNSGVRPVHKHHWYSIPLLASLATGCAPGNRAPVDIRNACNTFVSEVAPRHTPELRTGNNGLELILSFTPAHDPEARAILSAARKGPVELIVHPSLQRLQALGEEDGYLVLSVSSAAHAKQVEQLLCF
jgi:hypothetical protein